MKPTRFQLPAERRAERRRITSGLQESKAFRRAVAIFIDAQVFDGLSWKEAADRAGISHKRARIMFGHPRILSLMADTALKARAGETARNTTVLTHIRDQAMREGASAAERKAAIEAMKVLEGSRENDGITINGGQNVIAGYVVKLDGPAAAPMQIVPQSSRFVDREGTEDVA